MTDQMLAAIERHARVMARVAEHAAPPPTVGLLLLAGHDIPALVDEVRRLRAQLEAATKDRDRERGSAERLATFLFRLVSR